MNSMLISSGLPDNMWGEVVLSSNHILNRMPYKMLEVTPYELWKGYAPNLQYLKVWGCLAKVAFLNFKRESIEPRTFDAIFIGYAGSTYRYMRLNDKTICEYRDVEFFENVYSLRKYILPPVILNSPV